jgi:hypothetical protein
VSPNKYLIGKLGREQGIFGADDRLHIQSSLDYSGHGSFANEPANGQNEGMTVAKLFGNKPVQ